ncbi:MAG TPA: phage major capsid protein, partial [Rhizobiales bacterium]|nr:phage major capsid protein [Hyphomicrobiales bacterium]
MPEMETTDVSMLETKIAGPGTAPPADINAAMDEFLGVFDDFKQANDQRLDEIEKRMSADILTTQKVERINAALDTQKQNLDNLILKAGRPQLSGDNSKTLMTDETEHKSAFDAYVRKGNTGPLLSFEAKSL